MLKGQLNNLLSAEGTLCCVWELEFTARAACLRSCLILHHEHSPAASDHEGHKCPPSLPVKNDCGPGAGLRSALYKDKLLLWRIPAIQWVPTKGWALGIFDFIRS